MDQGKVGLIDIDNKRILQEWDSNLKDISNARLTDNDSKLITAHEDGSIRIWEVSGKLLTSIIPEKNIGSIDLKDNGKKLFNSDESLKIWEAAAKDVQFKAQNTNLLRAEIHKNSISILDTVQNKEISYLEGHSDKILSASFIPNQKLLISSSEDNSIKVWDTSKGELKATIVPFKNGNQIIYTPDGRFDYTDKVVLEHISYRLPDRFVDLVDIQDQYYTRGLLAKILSGKIREENIDGFVKALQIVPKIEHQYPEEDRLIPAGDKETEIGFNLKDQGTGIREVKVFVNGIETRVPEDIRKRLKQKSEEYDLTMNLPLVAGQNRVQITAYNNEGGPNTKIIDLKGRRVIPG
ncbi:MAG TPA: hypothetical protein PK683_19285, partial [Leptospiraceae bacterium]|nr:hypothetical protein [Leptospiraceae bacterium]